MESMNETKEEVTPGFLKAAGQYLSRFITVKGFKIGSISLGITYLVYRLYQFVWLRDLCKSVVKCCANTLYYLAVGLYNTAGFVKGASIKVFNAVTGINSIYARKGRTERDTITEFATMMMQEFQKLALSFDTDSTLLLKNLDQVLFQKDYDKIMDICYQYYGSSGPELKKCYANMMSYTYQVRLLVQDKQVREKLLDPKYLSVFTDVPAEKFFQYYGTTLENLLLDTPDPQKFYKITGKKLPENWETKYINNPDFKPYFAHISPEVGKQYMPEADYNTMKDPLGTVSKKNKEIERLTKENQDLSRKLEVEQMQKTQKISDYFTRDDNTMTLNEAMSEQEYQKMAETNHWGILHNRFYNEHPHLRGPENPMLGTTQQPNDTVSDMGATVAVTTMLYGAYRYIKSLFNRQPDTEPPKQQQQVVKQTSEPPAIPIDTPPGDDSMLRPKYRRKQDEQDEQQDEQSEQSEQSEINRDKEKTD